MTQHAAEHLEYQQQHGHDNKVAALYGTAVSMAVVAIIAVGLRLVCRQRLKLKLSYDDYIICLALVRKSTICLVCGCLLTVLVLAAIRSLSKFHTGNWYVPYPDPATLKDLAQPRHLPFPASMARAGLLLRSDGVLTAHWCPRRLF